MWKGVRAVYLKAAFSEICLHGRDETVGATTCCQVRVSDARRAIIFQCKSDMPHGGRGFHPNCFFCGACARAKKVAVQHVADELVIAGLSIALYISYSCCLTSIAFMDCARLPQAVKFK